MDVASSCWLQRSSLAVRSSRVALTSFSRRAFVSDKSVNAWSLWLRRSLAVVLVSRVVALASLTSVLRIAISLDWRSSVALWFRFVSAAFLTSVWRRAISPDWLSSVTVWSRIVSLAVLSCASRRSISLNLLLSVFVCRSRKIELVDLSLESLRFAA